MFFSVKEPLKIAGKTYIPCVCYPLPKFLELTVNELVNKDKAVVYSEYVYFQNGKVIKTEKMLKAEKKETKKSEKKSSKITEKVAELEPLDEGF